MELPGDQPDDVVFESRYGVRTIVLNRPNKLNSLNASMIRKIIPRLAYWEVSGMANVIVIKGAGERAMCAGGDVAALAQYNQEGPDGWKKSAEYFALEYKLDHMIAMYGKPFVALMDGITMGGGVGLSVHAPFRIATERSVFAMPETTIGFFPDVGASFFLPRLSGSLGTYLALTSERLTGPSVYYSGVATHYLHSTSLPHLESRLAELRFNDHLELPERLSLVNDAISEFCSGLPVDQPMQLSGNERRAIDRCFSNSNINDIVACLRAETGDMEAWAQKQLDTLRKRSPTALHVTLRMLRMGKTWSFAETLRNEFRVASRFMKHHDFTEGVTALLVRKEAPKWEPESLEAIPAGRNVARPFVEHQMQDPLQLFNSRDYEEYPFTKFGVPPENEVMAKLEQKPITPRNLLKAMVASRGGRVGIETVVQDIIDRKTRASDGRHAAQWVRDGDKTEAPVKL